MPILVRGKPNLQWLKFTMVTTEMVSSADNTARGFLPVTGGGLAAGQDAFSSKILKSKYSSKLLNETSRKRPLMFNFSVVGGLTG